MDFKQFQERLNCYGYRIGVMNHYDNNHETYLFILITDKDSDKYFKWEDNMYYYKSGLDILIKKIENTLKIKGVLSTE